jgi:cytochrome P450
MCVGMHLARLEMRILIEEWLNAIPEFEIDPTQTPRFHVGIFCLDEVPVVWKA